MSAAVAQRPVVAWSGAAGFGSSWHGSKGKSGLGWSGQRKHGLGTAGEVGRGLSGIGKARPADSRQSRHGVPCPGVVVSRHGSRGSVGRALVGRVGVGHSSARRVTAVKAMRAGATFGRAGRVRARFDTAVTSRSGVLGMGQPSSGRARHGRAVV